MDFKSGRGVSGTIPRQTLNRSVMARRAAARLWRLAWPRSWIASLRSQWQRVN